MPKAKAVKETTVRYDGLIFKRDKRDEKYNLAKLSLNPSGVKAYKFWSDGGWNGNQGDKPHCVGYAFAHYLVSSPVNQYVDPDGVYTLAQYVDDIDGEDYDGTTVRGAAKVLQNLGFISNYYWAKSLSDIIDAILLVGPVVVGTHWYGDMCTPDKDNYIKVGGNLLGGHSYLINGVNEAMSYFRIKNSWGKSWGLNSHAKISFGDFEVLMDKENFEACVATEARPKPKS